ncbi:MAG TPA: protein kinase [Actinomycetota bacterium]|nr:protein kinase [Actinomycetota bacterium]
MQVTNRVLADRYELGPLLDRGGMAEVHRGRDLVLGREVAIKLLSRHLLDDRRAEARFQREARAAAGLSHPGIVTVFDVGTDGDTPFIVMELVEGTTLAAMLREGGALPESEALDLGSRLADALAVAHQHGVVHRDVTPGNIIVRSDGAVKIMDFGIARAIEASQLTDRSVVVGTAAYMAPEQARGDAVDPRSDVYGLGAVLYHMVTGRPPFVADTAVALAYKHVSETPPPPSDLNPDVSRPAEAEILRALAKAPEDRHPSAEALAEGLRAVLGGNGPLGDTDELTPAPSRESGEARRRSRAAGILASLLTVAAASFAGVRLLDEDSGPSDRSPRSGGAVERGTKTGSGGPSQEVGQVGEGSTSEPGTDQPATGDHGSPGPSGTSGTSGSPGPDPTTSAVPTEEPSPTTEPSSAPSEGVG